MSEQITIIQEHLISPNARRVLRDILAQAGLTSARLLGGKDSQDTRSVLDVFTVALISIEDQRAFEDAAEANTEVIEFTAPPLDQNYHFEIPKQAGFVGVDKCEW